MGLCYSGLWLWNIDFGNVKLDSMVPMGSFTLGMGFRQGFSSGKKPSDGELIGRWRRYWTEHQSCFGLRLIGVEKGTTNVKSETAR